MIVCIQEQALFSRVIGGEESCVLGIEVSSYLVLPGRLVIALVTRVLASFAALIGDVGVEGSEALEVPAAPGAVPTDLGLAAGHAPDVFDEAVVVLGDEEAVGTGVARGPGGAVAVVHPQVRLVVEAELARAAAEPLDRVLAHHVHPQRLARLVHPLAHHALVHVRAPAVVARRLGRLGLRPHAARQAAHPHELPRTCEHPTLQLEPCRNVYSHTSIPAANNGRLLDCPIGHIMLYTVLSLHPPNHPSNLLHYFMFLVREIALHAR